MLNGNYQKNKSSISRKTISLIMALSLVLSISSFAFADNLDLNTIKKSRFTTTDKFDGSWTFSAEYKGDIGDSDLYVNLGLTSGLIDANAYCPMVFIYEKGIESLFSYYMYPVLEFYALVDNQLFSFESLKVQGNGGADKSGAMLAGTVFRDFLSAIQSAEEIAFRYTAEQKDGGHITRTIDPVSSKDLKDLIEAGKILEKANLWDKNPQSLLINDATYKASIEKK